MQNQRLPWVDWMKTIAMFFIIAGHCCVLGNKYIYVFSVPVFFILSGFLTKREHGFRLFWKKLYWNLILPMVLFFLINLVIQFAVQILKGTFDVDYLWQAPLLALIGMQGQGYEAGGLKAMWFVYTLIVCKLVFQFVPEKGERITLLLISLLCLLGAMLLHLSGFIIRNAFVNVLLAMPFFIIGYFLRPYKERLNQCPKLLSILLFFVGTVGVALCGAYNDIVMLYRCDYGRSVVLCLCGAICGTMVVYALSQWVKSHLVDFAKVIGGGTLIILGLHFVFIQIVSQFIRLSGIWLYVESFVLIVFFAPIIILVKNYFPILYGKNRIQ